VDQQGRVNYSDQPPPASLIKSATQKNYTGSVVEGVDALALRQARERYPVTLYTTPGCGTPCEQGSAHLARRGVPFASKDPSNDAEAQKALAAASARFRVPTLFVGSEKFEGYQENAWEAMLDRAGYPKRPAPGVKLPAKAEAVPSPDAPAPAAPPAGR
jgi:glutaredoxin